MRTTVTGPARAHRGAAAVVIAITLVLLCGATALSVDLGSTRSAQRSLSTASDAAALAAAHELAAGGSGCDLAEQVVADNEPDATMTDCTVDAGSTVTVRVAREVDHTFAPVIGISSSTVHSTTTARFGARGVGGARPFALCIDWLAAQPELQSWDRSGPVGPIRIPYGAGAHVAYCAGGSRIPGNWGSIDFDGGANSNADQQAWIEHGYPEPVFPGIYEGDPGAMGGSLAGALTALMSSGVDFPVGMFHSVWGQGANAQFHLVGFAQVSLVGFEVTGSAESRYLDLVFHPNDDHPGVACCDPSLPPREPVAVAICAVDEQLGAC